ncbi:phosphotransferase [Tateyamaria armeniaca]|uniref:Phosphotransferase n=1 Tax=Tateyamaria armeniaca TaxID=2518930 RepID=A0ABW8UQI7_9RHOB
MMAPHRHLLEAAQSTFDDLVVQAFDDPPAYRKVRHWIKSDANREHVVVRFDSDGAPPLILKQAFRPKDEAEFSGILRNLRAAEAATADLDDVTVPRILAVDMARQAYLMTFIPGQTLLDLCRQSDDHRPILRQAGRWLAAYHAGTFQEDRAFQPKFMARHMLHLVSQMDSGERRIKGQKRFKALAHQVQDWVGPCSGRISKVSAKHGDLNAHNILMSDGSVGAYDFLPHSHAPVGYDIARLLLSYTQMEGDISAIPQGHVMPPALFDAFFEGYGFVPPDDPGVTFLMRIQILTDWNRFNHNLTVSATLRFQRLRAIANRAFD